MLQTFSEREEIDLKLLARKPLFVSQDSYADDLLTMFRNTGIQLAFVRDANSYIIGLVTLENLVEELVGEIQSGYQINDEQSFAQREDGSWLIDGLVSFDRIWERIGIPAPSSVKPDTYTTLAEFIFAYLGHIPKVGDILTIEDVTLEVVDMDGRRIDRVLISCQK